MKLLISLILILVSLDGSINVAEAKKVPEVPLKDQIWTWKEMRQICCKSMKKYPLIWFVAVPSYFGLAYGIKRYSDYRKEIGRPLYIPPNK